jgi:hypothetical protein
MGAIFNGLELHKRWRTLILSLCFAIASVALYFGITVHFFIFKADENGLVLLLLLLFALILDVLITRILASSSRRTFGQVFIVVSAAILVGAIVVSFAIWRTHWLELVRELFHSTGTTR